MPLPSLVKTLLEKKLSAYCEKHSPQEHANELRTTYEIRGNSVTIFENRAPWRPEFTEWTSMPIAQMRYEPKTGKWTLYCADRNDRWHKYTGVTPAKEIDKILSGIDRDPTGIFWG